MIQPQNNAFSILIAQENPTVGAISANADLALDAWRVGCQQSVDLVALPEMFLTGYQLGDFITNDGFIQSCKEALINLATHIRGGPVLSIGTVWQVGDQLYNAYAYLKDGAIDRLIYKVHLPNTGVFDEKRHFAHGPTDQAPYTINGTRVGTLICEDGWKTDVAAQLSQAGADLLLLVNGSTYDTAKATDRYEIIKQRNKETKLPCVYINLISGQDDIIFDGGSFVLNETGQTCAQLPYFATENQVIRFDRAPLPDGQLILTAPNRDFTPPPQAYLDYQAICLGLRDYVRKSGFSKVVLGLSGGIDSALVATIACDALGSDCVHTVMLPSRYSSEGSVNDAQALIDALGCTSETISIEQGYNALLDTLAPTFSGCAPDTTEENLQSRLRGIILMAITNKFGGMLLTTGNKSEIAVGYCTIYGDMCGGYNPIGDLYKTQVFDMCRWRNQNQAPWMRVDNPDHAAIIPQNIIDKPPSAELRDDQKDSDSLPPYDQLDAILFELVENDRAPRETIDLGHDQQAVIQVAKLLHQSEFKRRQSAPIARISRRAFRLDRRYPIVNRYGGGI